MRKLNQLLLHSAKNLQNHLLINWGLFVYECKFEYCFSCPHHLNVLSICRLSVLFHGLDPVSSTRYTVYHTLVKVAGQVEQIKTVFTDLDKMRAQLGPCKPNNEQMQKLLRILHEALLNSRERFVTNSNWCKNIK